MMIVFPNAKINLGLFVTEKRVDGFHNLETVFYPINWCDALEAVPAKKFQFDTSGLNIPGMPEENLVVKAYHLIEEDHNIPPVHIHLHKAIPMGAGLGGGSSDAAFMLKLLNQLFELNISEEILVDYARKLGSDCAFFIKNKPVFAYEKGDHFEHIGLDLSGYKILCVYPHVHVGTGEAYGGVTPGIPDFDLRKIAQKDVEEWNGVVINDFEQHILKLKPELQTIKSKLDSMGALYSAMSGSGSTMFGIFENELPLPQDLQKYLFKWVN